MFSTGSVIRRIRKEKGMSCEDLGNIVGLTRQTISRYEKGNLRISSSMLQKIALALNVSPLVLLGMDEENPLGADIVEVENLGVVAGGLPIDALEDRTSKFSISEALAGTGKFATFDIKGDSMSPKINDGDVVLVKYQNMVNSGDVAVIYMYDYQVTCKQIFFLDNGSVRIHAYNESVYATKTFTSKELEEMNFQILGKVILVVRDNF